MGYCLRDYPLCPAVGRVGTLSHFGQVRPFMEYTIVVAVGVLVVLEVVVATIVEEVTVVVTVAVVVVVDSGCRCNRGSSSGVVFVSTSRL